MGLWKQGGNASETRRCESKVLMSQATLVTIVTILFGAVSTVATTLTVPEVRTAMHLEEVLPQPITVDLAGKLGLREEAASPPPAPPPPAPPPPAPPPPTPPAVAPTSAPTAQKPEANLREAVKNYYDAVVQENWTYTFDNLAVETRRLFTNKEEWIKKNQWFPDNSYEQELGSTVHILDVNVFPSGREADVTIQMTFKNGSRLAPRPTRFVFQDNSWKHLFLKEEIDIFRPGAPFEEFEKAQQTGSSQGSTKTNSKGDTSVKGKVG